MNFLRFNLQMRCAFRELMLAEFFAVFENHNLGKFLSGVGRRNQLLVFVLHFLPVAFAESAGVEVWVIFAVFLGEDRVKLHGASRTGRGEPALSCVRSSANGIGFAVSEV